MPDGSSERSRLAPEMRREPMGGVAHVKVLGQWPRWWCGVAVVVRWACEWMERGEGCLGMLTSGEEKVLGEVVAKLGNGDDGPMAVASRRSVDSSFNRQQGRALERQGACAKVGKVIRRSIGR